MPAISGSLVTLEIEDAGTPGTYTVLSGSRSVRWSASGTEIDTTTADDVDPDGVTWASYMGGIIDFSASTSGLLKDADAFDRLITMRLQNTVANMRVNIQGFGHFEGPMRVTTMEGGGEFNDAATYDISVRAAEAIAWTKAAA